MVYTYACSLGRTLVPPTKILCNVFLKVATKGHKPLPIPTQFFHPKLPANIGVGLILFGWALLELRVLMVSAGVKTSRIIK